MTSLASPTRKVPPRRATLVGLAAGAAATGLAAGLASSTGLLAGAAVGADSGGFAGAAVGLGAVAGAQAAANPAVLNMIHQRSTSRRARRSVFDRSVWFMVRPSPIVLGPAERFPG